LQAEDGIRDFHVTGVQTCALPILPRAVVPIEDQAAWWGTQAVLMRRRTVEQVLAWESDGAGWDIHLRNWALHTGTKIHTLIPNPVQHRGVPSLASKRGGGL